MFGLFMLKTKTSPDTASCWAKERETWHGSFGQLHMIHSRASSRLNTRREMIQKKKSRNAHSTFAGKCVSKRNELQHRIRSEQSASMISPELTVATRTPHS